MSIQPLELRSAAPQEFQMVDVPAADEVPTSSADRPPWTAAGRQTEGGEKAIHHRGH